MTGPYFDPCFCSKIARYAKIGCHENYFNQLVVNPEFLQDLRIYGGLSTETLSQA